MTAVPFFSGGHVVICTVTLKPMRAHNTVNRPVSVDPQHAIG